MDINTIQMIEYITNKPNWVFKLRRLAGKDYIASFTLLKRKGNKPVEFISPPLPKMQGAINNAYNRALNFINN